MFVMSSAVSPRNDMSWLLSMAPASGTRAGRKQALVMIFSQLCFGAGIMHMVQASYIGMYL